MSWIAPGRSRSLVALAACITVLGCSGAEWSDVKVAADYRRPAGRINVTVVSSAKGENMRELIQEFTTNLRDDLMLHRIAATVQSQSPSSPNVALDIKEWDPGDQAQRYLLGFGSGEGHIVVTVDVTNSDGATSLHGQVRGYVTGGFLGGSSMDAARAAARSIADAIHKGKPD